MGERSARKQGGKQKAKIVFLIIEIVIILTMMVVLYLVMNKTSEGPKVTYLDPKAVEIAPEVEEQKVEGGTMQGYMNVALFGLDAETDKQLFKGSRSDTIMIASINLDTGDIKLVSVYRDSYLNIGPYKANGKEVSEYYWKANSAYSYGGAEQAVKMLNKNLDLDITDFVAVGYKGLRNVIDGLGGIELDIDSAELKHINNYQYTIATDVLKCNYNPVTKTGMQTVDGLQAAAYCRIRYTKGDDFKRAERQREVLKAIEAKAKETDLVTLTKVFNDCIGDIYTSIDSDDILELMGNIMNYRIVEEGGFPDESLRTTANIGAKGSCVIPTDLEANVIWLHHFLFEDEEYTVSSTVRECSERVESETGKYINSR